VLVNGSARAVGGFAGIVRRIQTGFIYQYAFTMIIGLALALAFWLAPWFWAVLTRT
jgi:NADH-quinone oxidoreductase subunit L